MAASTLDRKRRERRKSANSKTAKSSKTSKASKKKNKTRRTIRLLRDLILILLVILLSYTGYHFFYAVFADEPVAESEEEGVDVTVRVDSGMSDLQVARMLKRNGLVENAYVFYAQVLIFSDSGASIRPGTYQLNTYMTAQDMLDVLTAETEDESGDAS